MSRRNLVRVRNCCCCCSRQWKIGESRNSNPYGRSEGKRRKGGRGRRVRVSLLSPRPLPAPFDSPHFQHGAFASKLRAQRKSLHCRLTVRVIFDMIAFERVLQNASTISHAWIVADVSVMGEELIFHELEDCILVGERFDFSRALLGSVSPPPRRDF